MYLASPNKSVCTISGEKLNECKDQPKTLLQAYGMEPDPCSNAGWFLQRCSMGEGYEIAPKTLMETLGAAKVFLYGPKAKVSNFGAINNMYTNLGKTSANYVLSDSQNIYTFLAEKLKAAQTYTVTNVDKYCKIAPTPYYSEPDSNYRVGDITTTTPYPVSGQVGAYQRIDMGTVSYFVPTAKVVECLTQSDVNNQLKPLAKKAVDNWWSQQNVTIYWADTLSRDNYNNPSFNQAVLTIGREFLRPLVNASSWFKGWKLVAS